jgi:hypothetical protein
LGYGSVEEEDIGARAGGWGRNSFRQAPRAQGASRLERLAKQATAAARPPRFGSQLDEARGKGQGAGEVASEVAVAASRQAHEADDEADEAGSTGEEASGEAAGGEGARVATGNQGGQAGDQGRDRAGDDRRRFCGSAAGTAVWTRCPWGRGTAARGRFRDRSERGAARGAAGAPDTDSDIHDLTKPEAL